MGSPRAPPNVWRTLDPRNRIHSPVPMRTLTTEIKHGKSLTPTQLTHRFGVALVSGKGQGKGSEKVSYAEPFGELGEYCLCGDCGAPIDKKPAVGYFQIGAEAGDQVSMFHLDSLKKPVPELEKEKEEVPPYKFLQLLTSSAPEHQAVVNLARGDQVDIFAGGRGTPAKPTPLNAMVNLNLMNNLN
ncbi:hypothetical protein Pelo_13592 [Pelomyxa schiedti]|nr:hypothetical protein Pelo_13592 [Pelomyxa schiedti]